MSAQDTDLCREKNIHEEGRNGGERGEGVEEVGGKREWE